MRVGGFSLIVFLIVLVELVDSLNRGNFPVDFFFGTASSAYQYEGAAHEGGKGPSIWDTFTARHPDKIKDRSSGVIAVDSYHRYKEDVGIMKNIGLNAYRFSISWSRVLPRGHLRGGINKEGIKYYNNLINDLLLNELCYREFGDRVKHWITLNEPLTFTGQGYADGLFAPGRCSKWLNCSAGDSSTEPYIVTHYQILAHAAAVRVYKHKYQIFQKGQIGVTLNSPWIMPLSESKADIDAASRALAFLYGWFMEPLKSGSYPVEMVTNVGDRLPKFSREQSLMVKGSFDFIGVNYYTTTYVANAPCTRVNPTVFTDPCVIFSIKKDGVPIGPKDGLRRYPKKSAEWFKKFLH
ncbi:Glycosyl hydrolases family 1, N-terminal conserved site [Sesbania bispinosa]|nr:Glycosyl hydrolases family 1, N-terminal conserved site [Sesbania bispinosa]